jgi:transposase-like protein
MARQRRKYTNEFKVEAVKLITEQGYSVAEAARSLDVGETLLRSWKVAFQGQATRPSPATAASPPSKRSSAASRPRTSASSWSARS